MKKKIKQSKVSGPVIPFAPFQQPVNQSSIYTNNSILKQPDDIDERFAPAKTWYDATHPKQEGLFTNDDAINIDVDALDDKFDNLYTNINSKLKDRQVKNEAVSTLNNLPTFSEDPQKNQVSRNRFNYNRDILARQNIASDVAILYQFSPSYVQRLTDLIESPDIRAQCVVWAQEELNYQEISNDQPWLSQPLSFTETKRPYDNFVEAYCVANQYTNDEIKVWVREIIGNAIPSKDVDVLLDKVLHQGLTLEDTLAEQRQHETFERLLTLRKSTFSENDRGYQVYEKLSVDYLINRLQNVIARAKNVPYDQNAFLRRILFDAFTKANANDIPSESNDEIYRTAYAIKVFEKGQIDGSFMRWGLVKVDDVAGRINGPIAIGTTIAAVGIFGTSYVNPIAALNVFSSGIAVLNYVAPTTVVAMASHLVYSQAYDQIFEYNPAANADAVHILREATRSGSAVAKILVELNQRHQVPSHDSIPGAKTAYSLIAGTSFATQQLSQSLYANATIAFEQFFHEQNIKHKSLRDIMDWDMVKASELYDWFTRVLQKWPFEKVEPGFEYYASNAVYTMFQCVQFENAVYNNLQLSDLKRNVRFYNMMNSFQSATDLLNDIIMFNEMPRVVLDKMMRRVQEYELYEHAKSSELLGHYQYLSSDFQAIFTNLNSKMTEVQRIAAKGGTNWRNMIAYSLYAPNRLDIEIVSKPFTVEQTKYYETIAPTNTFIVPLVYFGDICEQEYQLMCWNVEDIVYDENNYTYNKRTLVGDNLTELQKMNFERLHVAGAGYLSAESDVAKEYALIELEHAVVNNIATAPYQLTPQIIQHLISQTDGGVPFDDSNTQVVPYGTKLSMPPEVENRIRSMFYKPSEQQLKDNAAHAVNRAKEMTDSSNPDFLESLMTVFKKTATGHYDLSGKATWGIEKLWNLFVLLCEHSEATITAAAASLLTSEGRQIAFQLTLLAERFGKNAYTTLKGQVVWRWEHVVIWVSLVGSFFLDCRKCNGPAHHRAVGIKESRVSKVWRITTWLTGQIIKWSSIYTSSLLFSGWYFGADSMSLVILPAVAVLTAVYGQRIISAAYNRMSIIGYSYPSPIGFLGDKIANRSANRVPNKVAKTKNELADNTWLAKLRINQSMMPWGTQRYLWAESLWEFDLLCF